MCFSAVISQCKLQLLGFVCLLISDCVSSRYEWTGKGERAGGEEEGGEERRERQQVEDHWLLAKAFTV